MVADENFNDDELTALLIAGNEAAFTAIYNKYWKSLYNTAYNIIRNENASQDVVQDVFISLWRRRSEVKIESIKAYLHQAVRFGVLKAVRMRQTDESFYKRLAVITSDIIADDPVIYKEQQALLKKLIHALPDDYREAYLLSREESFTYKQIAVHLNISQKTVEKRLSRSLKYLRANITSELNLVILLASYIINKLF